MHGEVKCKQLKKKKVPVQSKTIEKQRSELTDNREITIKQDRQVAI